MKVHMHIGQLALEYSGCVPNPGRGPTDPPRARSDGPAPSHLAAARARRADPATSHAAAARVDASGLAAVVLAELRKNGHGTTHELAARLDLGLVTVSPRMKPLETAGHVRRAGKRDGRTVWAAT